MKSLQCAGPVVVVSVLVGAAAAQQPDRLPRSSASASIRVAGEALGTVLPRLGRSYGVTLTPGRELAGQRITLYAKDAPLEEVARGMQDLLSVGAAPGTVWDGSDVIRLDTDGPRLAAPADATVVWSPAGEGKWNLESSVRRRRLVQQFRDIDLQNYRKYMSQEALRADREAAKAAATRNQGQEERLALGLIFSALGEAGRERLLAGQPFSTPVGRLPEPAREHVTRMLQQAWGSLGALPRDEVELHWIAVTRGRDPGDPKGVHLFLSVVHPSG
ncbi:MAG TPA: hypothetical protein VFU47_03135, partial [Armatimonadota bacterium]|nr:hypothetical protein [Armatimonadota bacterium]